MEADTTDKNDMMMNTEGEMKKRGKEKRKSMIILGKSSIPKHKCRSNLG